MKPAFTIILTTLSMTTPGLTAYAESFSRSTIPVVLPSSARVVFERDYPITGQVIGLTQAQLTLSHGDFSQSFPTTQVTRIEFPSEFVWIRTPAGGTVKKSRNLNSINSNQQIWRNVPFSALQLTPDTAQLRLGSVVSDEVLREISLTITDSTYVVDVIEFEASKQTMTIKATPIQH